MKLTLSNLERQPNGTYKLKTEQKPVKAKYGNKKTIVDGITFDSTKEADRYCTLKFLLAQGIITDLKLQVAYQLNEGGKFSYKYFADFVYYEGGKLVVEDVKGARTKVYLKKKKLMLKVWGIAIREV